MMERNKYNVLVDYDNIDFRTEQKGLMYIINEIIDVSKKIFQEDITLRIRLYGGWFAERNLTKKAINIMSEIEKASYISKDCSIIVELALSLILYPTDNLYYTYRKYNIDNSIKCKEPKEIGCNDNASPINVLKSIVNDKKCTKLSECVSCSAKLNELLTKDGQKLVDTMIVSDLIYLSENEKLILLVSMDDDMVPGMLSAMYKECKIIHITKNNSCRYCSGYKNYKNVKAFN